ncbi:MAG: MFS transporter, partial [Rhodospirillales bacterium]|nr:MFS transporter [Rhodospirillales bacterium]
THSGTWLGAIAFADLFPTIILTPLAGILADRFDRLVLAKWLQVIAVIQALALAVLAFTGLVTVELLFILTLISGADQAFYQPVRSAMTPNLVAKDDLPAAIAINSVSWNSARFIGPAIAGIILVYGSASYTFVFNAITYVTFLIALWNIRLAPEARGKRTTVAVGALAELREGYAYAFSHSVIGPILIILGVASLFGRPVVELLPGFAAQVFGRGPEGLAWLTSAMGAGAVVAGMWLAMRGRTRGLVTLAVFAPFFTALFLLMFTYTARFEIAVLCMAGAGVMYVTTGTTIQTIIQTVADPAIRGRVLALYGMIWMGGASVGALFMGILSEWFGLKAPIAGGAVVILAMCLWSFRVRRPIARLVEGRLRDNPG